MRISTDEAIGIIKKWGVDCDNFVACNYHQIMVGGYLSDNSQECADYFLECLRIVTAIAIKKSKNGQNTKE